MQGIISPWAAEDACAPVLLPQQGLGLRGGRHLPADALDNDVEAIQALGQLRVQLRQLPAHLCHGCALQLGGQLPLSYPPALRISSSIRACSAQL
jgi:hypothetical protein